MKVMTNLYKMFIDLDATQIEVNPLVISTTGKVYCVDAKITFDDSAEFRQGEVFKLRDVSQEVQHNLYKRFSCW